MGPSHRRTAALAVSLALALAGGVLDPLAPVPARAATQLTPGPVLSTGPLGHFWGNGTTESFSGTAVGDTLGGPEPEVLFGGMDGIVYAFSLTGALVGQYGSGGGSIEATPALVDLNGDGKLDVVTANVNNGWVVALDGPSGRVLFTQNTAPAGLPGLGGGGGVFGTPAVGDIDGDGGPEIVSSSFPHYLWAWHLDGRVVAGFPKYIWDSSWSSPAIADLDGDGRREVVVGGDMDDYAAAPFPPGGMLHAYHSDGRAFSGFPRTFSIYEGGSVIWSSPAIADLDGDNLPDITFGTGTNGPWRSHKVYAVDRVGRPLAGWAGGVDVGAQAMASPAVGDLDGDGRPEVAVLNHLGQVVVIDGAGRIKWVACNGWLHLGDQACRAGEVHGSVVMADVDADGVVEVVSTAERSLRTFDGRTGALESEGHLDPRAFAPPAAPSVAQVNGETWIFQQAILDSNGSGHRDVGDRQAVFTWRTGRPLGAAPWPTFHGNLARTGSLWSPPQGWNPPPVPQIPGAQPGAWRPAPPPPPPPAAAPAPPATGSRRVCRRVRRRVVCRRVRSRARRSRARRSRARRSRARARTRRRR